MTTTPPTDPACSIEDRLAVLEAAVAAGRTALRTRRLVVTDEGDEERIVGEVVNGHAELRVERGGEAETHSTAVALYAWNDAELDPAVGVHLLGGGNSVAALHAQRDGMDRWHSDLVVGTVYPTEEDDDPTEDDETDDAAETDEPVGPPAPAP